MDVSQNGGIRNAECPVIEVVRPGALLALFNSPMEFAVFNSDREWGRLCSELGSISSQKMLLFSEEVQFLNMNGWF